MTKDLLEKLYITYHRELYLYSLSLCKDPHESEILVSDTFFKALLTVDKETSYFKYWLFRVCKNLFLDKLKKEKHFYKGEIHKLVLSTKETPLDNIIDSEERRKLFESVMSLNSSHREAIVLYYYNDFSIREISLQIQKTEGATKQLLHRAREKLKNRLEEDHEL